MNINITIHDLYFSTDVAMGTDHPDLMLTIKSVAVTKMQNILD